MQRKSTQKSVKKLIDAADKLLLGKVIVEFAIVARIGKPFCIATYNMESDDHMSLTSYMIFEKIDEFCTGGFLTPSLRREHVTFNILAFLSRANRPLFKY